jgi:hypothetical protein
MRAFPRGFCQKRRMTENPTPTPVPPAPPVPAKKSVPPIAWVGMGCGALLVVCVIVASLLVGWCKRKVDEFAKNPEKAAAEMVVKFNPDLEMVKSDDEKGEMTIRSKNGEVMTFSYKDIAEGRITVRDKDGNVTTLGSGDLSQIPSWVPRLPNAATETSVMHSETPDQVAGMLNITTSDGIEDVEAFLKNSADGLGLSESSRSSFTSDGVGSRTVSYGGDTREITAIMTIRPDAPLQVQITYSEKK